MAELALLVGTAASVAGTVGAGYAAKKSGEFENDQAKIAATQERAAGQREMLEERKKTEQVLSRQRALAASSGAGTINPTILDIMEDTAGRGEYLSQIARYKSEDRARGLLDQGKAAKAKGKAAFTASILEGVGTAALGYGKYKGLGFKSKDDDDTYG